MPSERGTAADQQVSVADIRRADAAYSPFPAFGEWLERCVVDQQRWQPHEAALAVLKTASPDVLRRSMEIVKRAAAVDTGAIEGLYDTDRGFTFTVAMEATHWEAALAQKGSNVPALFRSQLAAYDLVLDFATQQVPIGEAWIRVLHEQICAAQETYVVWTEIGLQKQLLPKGEYKHLPNHVRLADGTLHSYAPVEATPGEMHRFCDELNGDRFQQAHAILQAAYAHHSLTCIHPFADGNGRVARALASVFTSRAFSIPLLVLVDNRKAYYEALAQADEGRYQPFIDFVLDRMVEAVRLAIESIQAATTPTLDESLSRLRRLYVTKGGYRHEEVDQAGYVFADLFTKALTERGQSLNVPDVLDVKVERVALSQVPVSMEGYRPTREPRVVQVQLRAAKPLGVMVDSMWSVIVPVDCGDDDDLLVVGGDKGQRVGATIRELLPTPSSAFQLRLKVAVERILGGLAAGLQAKASARVLRQ